MKRKNDVENYNCKRFKKIEDNYEILIYQLLNYYLIRYYYSFQDL
jgi:hypothetical protein